MHSPGIRLEQLLVEQLRLHIDVCVLLCVGRLSFSCPARRRRRLGVLEALTQPRVAVSFSKHCILVFGGVFVDGRHAASLQWQELRSLAVVTVGRWTGAPAVPSGGRRSRCTVKLWWRDSSYCLMGAETRCSSAWLHVFFIAMQCTIFALG